MLQHSTSWRDKTVDVCTFQFLHPWLAEKPFFILEQFSSEFRKQPDN